jgi:indolepyruvate ferredoxin oxidoreductase
MICSARSVDRSHRRGKSYLDVRQALTVGLTSEMQRSRPAHLQDRCPPIGRLDLMEFAAGPISSSWSRKSAAHRGAGPRRLYGTANQPVCIGKKDERGNWLPRQGRARPNDVAICTASACSIMSAMTSLRRASRGSRRQRALAETGTLRPVPYSARCPHNSSTVVPQAARLCGDRCHYMAQWMDRRPGFTQMGGEGANWIGEAPFSTRPSVPRSATAPTTIPVRSRSARHPGGVNITFKILFNDASR